MPISFPTTFPFFEVAVPSRRVLPDLSSVEVNVDKNAPLSSQEIKDLEGKLLDCPELGDIKKLVSFKPGKWTPQSAAASQQLQFGPKYHWDIFSHLKNNLQRDEIPEGYCKKNDAGLNQEINAWLGAYDFFGLSASPGWMTPEGTTGPGNLLQLDALLPSVWIDRSKPNIPYVLDQVWVVSWLHAPDKRILVAVEIDGPSKWDVAKNDGFLKGKEREVLRSKYILEQKVALFRIGSDSCKTFAEAKQQIVNLWGRLSTAAFMQRMNFANFDLQDAQDTNAFVQMALQNFQNSGENFVI